MKIRDVIDIIEKDGWYQVYQKGSHRQYKHNKKKGRVTIAGHVGDDLAPGTLNSVFKQAGIKKNKTKRGT
jgi:predicted RNA binding protein YcfA (HicA-like mRNA interferase family)